MKKTYLWLAVLAVAIIGSLLIFNNTSDYVVVVDREIAELESELADVEAAIESGILTPEEAVEAEVMIARKIESINASIERGQGAKLTEAQKAQLNEALERLKRILVNYQATLLVVEEQVESLPEAEKQRLRRGSNQSSRKLTEVVLENVAEIEVVLEEIIEDYEEVAIEDLFAENASSSEEQSEAWLVDLATTTDADGEAITDDSGNEGGQVEENVTEEETAEETQGDEFTPESADGQAEASTSEDLDFGFVEQEEEPEEGSTATSS